MANGNGKNGKNGDAKNGDAKNGDATKDSEESSGGKTVRSGASRSGSAAASTTAGESATQWQVKPAETATIVVPARSMVPVLAGTAALVATTGAIYAFYRWRQGQLAAQDGATPLPDAEQAPTPAATQPASPAPTPTSPPAQTPIAKPGNTDPNYWGTTTRGEVYRPLFTKIEAVTGMPLRLYLCVVANREGEWVRSARNKSKGEVKASTDAIANGAKRGNPSPKYAASLAASGSGGLFGALAPYVAWTGLDEDYTPYIDADWPIIEDPIVAAICAAKYYQRIVGGGRYPVFANPAQPSPEDNYRVRLGWASPTALKESPNGELFQDVKARFDEDLAELGLKITDLAPPNADRWPGLAAVVAAMKGFPVTWK